MSTKDFHVASFDGLKLHCRTWSPKADIPVKARILFLHGFSEFVDAYESWFPMVTEAGYEVTSYDQRGFGATALTPNDRGRSNEAGVMGDLETMVEYVLRDERIGQLPLILWGFSMGGALCLNYMVIGKQKAKFDLFISVGPYIRTSESLRTGLNAVKLWALPYIVKIYPTYVDTAELKPELANNNPSNWELYRKQPLRHTRATAEFMSDAITRGQRLLDPKFTANIVDRPLLLSHGQVDPICDVKGSEEFFAKAKLTDKTLDLYEGLPHELMQCLDKDRLEHWRRVRQWLDEHVAQLQPAAA